MHIYAHNANSAGAKALAQELGILRIRHNNSNFRGDVDKTVLNWGSSMLPMEVTLANVINQVPAKDLALSLQRIRFPATSPQQYHLRLQLLPLNFRS